MIFRREVPGRYAYIIILPVVIKLCKTPIDKFEDTALGINDDVLGLNIAMHDAMRVGEI